MIVIGRFPPLSKDWRERANAELCNSYRQYSIPYVSSYLVSYYRYIPVYSTSTQPCRRRTVSYQAVVKRQASSVKQAKSLPACLGRVVMRQKLLSIVSIVLTIIYSYCCILSFFIALLYKTVEVCVVNVAQYLHLIAKGQPHQRHQQQVTPLWLPDRKKWQLTVVGATWQQLPIYAILRRYRQLQLGLSSLVVTVCVVSRRRHYVGDDAAPTTNPNCLVQGASRQ